jgi:hypothetical protein
MQWPNNTFVLGQKMKLRRFNFFWAEQIFNEGGNNILAVVVLSS